MADFCATFINKELYSKLTGILKVGYLRDITSV